VAEVSDHALDCFLGTEEVLERLVDADLLVAEDATQAGSLAVSMTLGSPIAFSMRSAAEA
jgi:hypothetical protein